MKIDDLNEMALPSNVTRTKKFYHGTSNENAGKAILRDGIKPPQIEVKRGPNMIPVPGKVYLTEHISYAIMYVIGGDMAGHQIPDSFIARNGRYGYLFEVSGSDLLDIQPDEDSIGQLYNTLDSIRSNGVEYALKHVSQSDKVLALNVWNDRPFANAFMSFFERTATDAQIKRVKQGEYQYFAASGKRVVSKMSDMMKQKLVDYGAHVAHEGVIYPNRSWRFDKLRTSELDRDGRNFFELAERIN